MIDELLRIEDLYGYYIEKTILDHVAFSLFNGEILCLFGLNNSGKSTIIRIFSGKIHGVWEKRIYYKGNPITIDSPTESKKLGIACIQSNSSLLDTFTVSESLFIMPEISPKRTFISYKKINKKTAQILKKFDLDINPTDIVCNLSQANRFLLEIVKNIVDEKEIFFIDCLHVFRQKTDFDKLRKIIISLRETGKTILFTSNNYHQNLSFADRIYILRDGMIVKEMTASNFTPKLLKKYAAKQFYIPTSNSKVEKDSSILLDIKNLNVNKKSHALSFKIFKGAITAVASQNKNLLHELANYFIDPYPQNIFVKINGMNVTHKKFCKWLKRNSSTILNLSKSVCRFYNMSVLENITVSAKPSFPFPRLWINKKVKSFIATDNKHLIDVVELLDKQGGDFVVYNAFLLIKRLIYRKIQFVVFYCPEFGLDPLSITWIYSVIEELCKKGIGVLLLTENGNEASPFCSHTIWIG